MSTSGYQPDIFQRYTVLARVAAAVRAAIGHADPTHVLDLGCGPQQLAATFLGPGFRVTRADVDDFGDPDIVRLSPGMPLPFETGSVPLVIAVDVLEHLPADERPQFIRECRRVATDACVVCFPQGRSEVQRAEQVLQQFAETVSGGTGITFLKEHFVMGLPVPHVIVEEFAAAWPEVLTFPNAPLADWLLFNTFDLAYACDFADGPEKARFNEHVNARLPLTGPGDCYRLFVVGARSEAVGHEVRRAFTEMEARRPSTELDERIFLTQAIERFRHDLRSRDPRGRVTDPTPGPVERRPARLRRSLAESDGPEPAGGPAGDVGSRAVASAAPARRPERKSAARRAAAGIVRRIRGGLVRGARPSSLESLVLGSGLFDPEFYATRAKGAGSIPLRHFLEQTGAGTPSPHPLFDPEFYVAHNPAAAGVNPLVHFLTAHPGTACWPHPLFDTAYYLERNADVRDRVINPLVHYLRHGGREGRSPHPLFDGRYYLGNSPDVAAAGLNPLEHWLRHGARERRRPHPLIDLADYLGRNPDVADVGMDPLSHYIRHGVSEGRRLTLLFDPDFYRARYPDVARAGTDPFLHYLVHGAREGRWPNPYFDPAYYLRHCPDVEAAGMEPLSHYVLAGAAEGRPASASFDTSRYLADHPDVASAGDNPILAHLRAGGGPQPAATASRVFVPPCDLLPWFNPLTLSVQEGLRHAPALNVLLPGLSARHLSGGPNTALQIACRLAASGVRTRLVATDAPLDPDVSPLWAHLLALVGVGERPTGLEVIDAHDRARPFVFGPNDLFFATAWWTAQMARYACEHTRHSRFVYLIQDYEPLLHAASTPQALAEETYGLDYVPIVNSSLLRAYLEEHRVGRFGDPAFAAAALTFEPAVDRTRFHPEPPRTGRSRRLLFYARPVNGLRNLFELGVAALMKAVGEGIFDGAQWEFLGMGEPFAPVPLGRGLTLSPTPWLDLDGYAAQMRQSDVLVSLMLSPHPSYPPLEMAACGGRVVTTTFGTKTAERLATLSPRVFGAPATIEGIASSLKEAVEDLGRDDRRPPFSLSLPSMWDESLESVMRGLRNTLLEWWSVPEAARAIESVPWPRSRYEVGRFEAIAERASRGLPPAERGLLSFVTAVWNTSASILRELADSLLADAETSAYEWVILDNGSTVAETLQVLDDLRRHPAVRIERSPDNLGIVAGTRRLLESARHRYVAFVDHDDLVTHDCARVLSEAIRRADFPAVLYTDEDKYFDGGHLQPYFKPGWDPVLFLNSCYTAHLTVVDRQRALALGACTDPATEGSYDWDTVMRFVAAGSFPSHVAEVLYSWRIHPGSTAADLEAKPYVLDSQKRVLQRFLDIHPVGHRFEVVQNPLFDSAGDWWIRRRPVDPPPLTSAVWTSRGQQPASAPSLAGTWDHEIVPVPGDTGVQHLAALADACAGRGRFLHLLWDGLRVTGDDWAWEAIGLLELFPDAVMVGGRGHREGRVVYSGGYFGFGGGYDGHDEGRGLGEPGYFSQHLKAHSVSCVPVWHAVVRPAFLAEALQVLDGLPISFDALGPWLGAHARRIGRRVVYTPVLEAQVPDDVLPHRTPADGALFTAVNADLVPDRGLLSSSVGLEPGTAHDYVLDRRRAGPGDAMRIPYRTWLDARTRVRGLGSPSEGGTSLSLITTIYSGTDAALFETMAASVVPQLQQQDEWLVLAHGPLRERTTEALGTLRTSPRVEVLRRPQDLGITAAMRVCLESAHGDYVVPVDGDDVLAPDALRVLRAALHPRRPVLAYSDEDTLVGDSPGSPYARPDFDPVLALESSWIWHLCAFDRASALDVGVYGDQTTEFCTDWDTVQRLVRLGRPVAHIREVLYHWRRHAGSHTNTSVGHPGSRVSVGALLNRVREQLPAPGRFTLEPFPLFRGAEEPYLARRHDEAPETDWYVAAEHGFNLRAPRSARGGYSFRIVTHLPTGREMVPALVRLLASSGARLIGLSHAAVEPADDWMWEAVRVMELHPHVAIVSGRLVNESGVVTASCGIMDASGVSWQEGVHGSRTEPGPFALYLKPHEVHFACGALFVVDAGWLRQCVHGAPRGLEWADLGWWLSAAAWRSNRSVVYSPLVEGLGPPESVAHARRPARRAAETMVCSAVGDRVMGTAGLSAIGAATC